MISMFLDSLVWEIPTDGFELFVSLVLDLCVHLWRGFLPENFRNSGNEMKWIHLSHDLQEMYSTSIPVDFVSRVSFLAHPTPTIYWTSSPSWPSSPSSPSWPSCQPAFENDLIWCLFRPLLVWSASLSSFTSRTFQGLWDMLAGSPGRTVLFSVGSPPLSGFRVRFPAGVQFRMEHPVDLGSGQQFR